jgi:hypothetical protein
MLHIFTNAEYTDMIYAVLIELQSALMLTVEFSKMCHTK